VIGPDLSRVEIYIRPGITDMRKAINGLSIMASEQMEKDPLSGAVFLFCNRYRRIIKALHWDKNGFCLWLVGRWRGLLGHASVGKPIPLASL